MEPLDEPWARLRWARTRAGFATAKEAADRLAMSEVTYRSYEKPVANGGRWPRSTAQVQRIAKVVKASWIWLETGEGDPDTDADQDSEDIAAFMRAAGDSAKAIDLASRPAAMNAALSVLHSFRRKD
jgi:transcriptional regulator with XRE-family HTH domain